MGIRTIVFPVVAVIGVKSGKCLCGKKRIRREKFEHTINPFNKTPSGREKTREEVLADVKAERDAWLKEPVRCQKCPKEPK